jgi:hypothetical protein
MAQGDDLTHAVRDDQRTACGLPSDVQAPDTDEITCAGCLLRMAIEIRERLEDMSGTRELGDAARTALAYLTPR